MNSIKITRNFVAAAAVYLTASTPCAAVDKIYDGVYSAAGLEVIVSDGIPATARSLNDSQGFIDELDQILRQSFASFASDIEVSYSTQTTDTSTTIQITLSSSELGNIGTITATSTNIVLENTSTTYRVNVEISITAETSFGSIPGQSFSYEESFVFSATGFTCTYGGGTVLTRSLTGSGLTLGSPLIPTNPNWKRPEILEFPIVSPNQIVQVDPPFAGGFHYTVTKGREERFSGIVLPPGHGKKIRIFAQPSDGGKMRLVGKYKSGSNINLTSKAWLSGGTKKFLIKGIKPKVNLKKKAPYVVGLKYTNLEASEYTSKIKISPKKVSKKKKKK